MYSLLIRLMAIAALLELGMSFRDLENCGSKHCLRIEKASRDVLKIHWKPISIFPEEAKRYR